jgi:hypothetical protein
MDKSLPEHELFDNYIKGLLSEEESRKFELDLEQDKDLKKNFSLYSDIVSEINETGKSELKSFIRDIDKDLEDPNLFFIRTRRYWPVAASIIILISFALFYLLNVPSIDSDELFASYFEPYPNNIIHYARGAQIPPELEDISLEKYNKIVQGMKLYDAEKFQEAYDVFTENINQADDNEVLLFYLAITQLENDELKLAIQNLELISQDLDNIFYDASQWYLALAYLTDKQIKKSKKLLKEIINNDNQFSERANKLLSDIKEK